MPTLSSSGSAKSEAMPPNTQREDEKIEQVVESLVDWKIESDDEEYQIEKKKVLFRNCLLAVKIKGPFCVYLHLSFLFVKIIR